MELISKYILEKREDLRHYLLFKKKVKMLNEIKVNKKRIIFICSDCVGGRLMKDFEMPIFTPTINLYFNAGDFIKLLKAPEHYFKAQLIEDGKDQYGRPIGNIDGIRIFFGHAHHFEEANAIWNSGCRLFEKSIKKDHEIVVIMTDRNMFDESMLIQFENLPYKYKVLFTHKKYDTYPSTFYMKGEDKLCEVETMTNFENKFSLKRRYDRFDFLSWFKQIYSKKD